MPMLVVWAAATVVPASRALVDESGLGVTVVRFTLPPLLRRGVERGVTAEVDDAGGPLLWRAMPPLLVVVVIIIMLVVVVGVAAFFLAWFAFTLEAALLVPLCRSSHLGEPEGKAEECVTVLPLIPIVPLLLAFVVVGVVVVVVVVVVVGVATAVEVVDPQAVVASARWI